MITKPTNDNKSFYFNEEERNINDSGTDEKIEKIKKDLNDMADSITNFFESIEHKLTYDEYINMLGTTIDKRIIKCQIEQKITFVGGKLKMAIDRKNNFVNFKAEYYYKSSSGQWITNSETGKTRISKFNLKDSETVKFLNSSEIIELQIDPPIEN